MLLVGLDMFIVVGRRHRCLSSVDRSGKRFDEARTPPLIFPAGAADSLNFLFHYDSRNKNGPSTPSLLVGVEY